MSSGAVSYTHLDVYKRQGGNYAAVVPESTAVETANMLLSQRGGVLFKGGKAQVETIFQGNEPMYYVIRFEKGGWALISAEDTVDPLLGYSFDSEYVSKGQPEWIKGWLKEYTDQIKTCLLYTSRCLGYSESFIYERIYKFHKKIRKVSRHEKAQDFD